MHAAPCKRLHGVAGPWKLRTSPGHARARRGSRGRWSPPQSAPVGSSARPGHPYTPRACHWSRARSPGIRSRIPVGSRSWSLVGLKRGVIWRDSRLTHRSRALNRRLSRSEVHRGAFGAMPHGSRDAGGLHHLLDEPVGRGVSEAKGRDRGLEATLVLLRQHLQPPRVPALLPRRAQDLLGPGKAPQHEVHLLLFQSLVGHAGAADGEGVEVGDHRLHLYMQAYKTGASKKKYIE